MKQGGNHKQTLGRWGERVAAWYLRKKGFHIKAQNFFTRYGELDIVAERAGIVYFFEVKTRRTEQFGTHENVSFFKRQRLYRAARLYLQAQRISDEQSCQCMVVVIIVNGSRCTIRFWNLTPF